MRRFPFVLALSLVLNFALWSGAAALFSRVQKPGMGRFEVVLRSSPQKLTAGRKRGNKKSGARPSAFTRPKNQPLRQRRQRLRRMAAKPRTVRSGVSFRPKSQIKKLGKAPSAIPTAAPILSPLTTEQIGKSNDEPVVDEGLHNPDDQGNGPKYLNLNVPLSNEDNKGGGKPSVKSETLGGPNTEEKGGSTPDPSQNLDVQPKSDSVPIDTSKPGSTPSPKPQETPTATPPPPPPPPTPEPTATPTPLPTPTPQPTPTQKLKGETRKAIIIRQVLPRIPEGLKNDELRASVSVRVEISANGISTYTLRNSSGNPAVDALALKALRRWRWKPALQDGEPVASTQNFKFEFEVK